MGHAFCNLFVVGLECSCLAYCFVMVLAFFNREDISKWGDERKLISRFSVQKHFGAWNWMAYRNVSLFQTHFRVFYHYFNFCPDAIWFANESKVHSSSWKGNKYSLYKCISHTHANVRENMNRGNTWIILQYIPIFSRNLVLKVVF